jgi:hypothetical protein
MKMTLEYSWQFFVDVELEIWTQFMKTHSPFHVVAYGAAPMV